MRKLTIGKLRGMQRIATPGGVFVMVAMDQRLSLAKLMNPQHPETISYAMLVARKRELCEALAPAASAVLLDPVFGAAQLMAAGAVPRDVGLLVAVEAAAYGAARVDGFLPDWSVAKIKRMGADAAKFLLYYNPGRVAEAASQREVVREFVNECNAYDLPSLVEPIAVPVGDGDQEPTEAARRKSGVVVQTARDLTALNLDVLKAQFPVEMQYETDEGRMLDYCRQITEASQAPWVLLSAGAAYEDFAKQVRIACQAGASGFLAGRGIWQEGMPIDDERERRRWLGTVAAERTRRLGEIAGEHARPWWKAWADSPSALVDVPEGWYRQY